jgi:glucose/arabinose dehydrogenase
MLCACAPASSVPGGSPQPIGSPGASGSASPSSPPAASPPVAEVGLQPVLDGLTAPVDLVPFPDASGRSALVEQHGLVHVLVGDALLPEPFLDVRSEVIRLSTEYDERGLLGLAFHPEFATNGRVFVYYSAPVREDPVAGIHDHTNVLAEFQVPVPGEGAVDPASERRILEFEQPQFSHSGGGLGFGPDGLLYLGTGDGGGTGDRDYGHSPMGNAQDLAKLNGKVLRIDVDGDEPYAIPADNPFVDLEGARPEIYALGFRNPWRLTWEPRSGRLLVSDVGWGSFEEIDVVERGANLGWRIREGDHCVNLSSPLNPLPTCAAVDQNGIALAPPVVEYTHADIGVAVVGGRIYRGAAIAALRGRYVFADWSAARQTPEGLEIGGTLLVADPQPDGAWPWQRLTIMGGPLREYVTGIGEDGDGELYVMVRTQPAPTGDTGRVLRLVPPA